MVVAQYRGKLCHGCRLRGTVPPWPLMPGTTHPTAFATHVVEQGPQREQRCRQSLGKDTLVVWFSVHCRVVPLRTAVELQGVPQHAPYAACIRRCEGVSKCECLGCECLGVRVSQSASVSVCECFGVRGTFSDLDWRIRSDS